MDAFSPTPPAWTEEATHAQTFFCPQCGSGEKEADKVWVNRRAPVTLENRRRKWQEFYHCNCGRAWWAWSDDRPPNEYADRQPPPLDDPDPNNFYGYF
jgi:predicted RNA-binding Zn-ribbon protein involved in translation (DUF1610 family)